MELYCGNCDDILRRLNKRNVVIVTDPPFNIGYHYASYKDKLPDNEYYKWLASVMDNLPCVIVHYPESLYKLSYQMGRFPNKIVSWVYNSNTAKQHRDIAFFDVEPNFKQVTQPYKNLNDKRIKALIAKGHKGGRLYDWWNVNQVKNVNKEKTNHPCQMPLEIMKNIIGILPKGVTVLDPFMGSGTTGVACKQLGVEFIGIEIDEEYYRISVERINNTVKNEGV